MFQTESFTIPEQTKKVAGRVASGDDHDVSDTRINECLNGVVDHRLVIDWQQVLVGHLRERHHARAKAAGEDDALHGKRSWCGRPRSLLGEAG